MDESDAEPKGRVLVVDDKEVNRELLLQDLEDAGFECREAANGPAAQGATCAAGIPGRRP